MGGGAVLRDPEGKIFDQAFRAAEVKTPFQRKGNTYTMKMYVPAPEKEIAHDHCDHHEEKDDLENIRAIVEEAGWKLVPSKIKSKRTSTNKHFGGQD